MSDRDLHYVMNAIKTVIQNRIKRFPHINHMMKTRVKIKLNKMVVHSRTSPVLITFDMTVIHFSFYFQKSREKN